VVGSKVERKAKMMKNFVNLTPHDINLNNQELYPSQGLARVSASYTNFDENLIAEQEFGEITGLPAPLPDTIYIVSGIVAAAAKKQGRTDCVAPASGHPECVRDERGQVKSVPGFVR
jgi:hypothetical protein